MEITMYTDTKITICRHWRLQINTQLSHVKFVKLLLLNKNSLAAMPNQSMITSLDTFIYLILLFTSFDTFYFSN